MNQYRVGFNKQVLFHSDKELSNEEIIKEALSRVHRIKGKTTITRGKYQRREYKLTEYDKAFLSGYKKSKKPIEAKSFFQRYKTKVSLQSEVIAGYNQFTKVLDTMFESGKKRLKANGKWTDRKVYYCKHEQELF